MSLPDEKHNPQKCKSFISSPSPSHSLLLQSRDNTTPPSYSPLDHTKLMILIAANYAQMDMESYFLYFVLADISAVGCPQSSGGLDHYYSILMTITNVVMLLWAPLSGYLTDLMYKKANVLLYGCAVLQLILEIAIFFVPKNVYYVIGLQILRNLLETQLYNAIWKVFKMRLYGMYQVNPGVQVLVCLR